MSVFYYPCGERMDGWKTFVSFYNNIYYLDSNKWIVGISQNSRCVENIIDGLLRDGIKNRRDILRILAWKMGKINQEASELALAKDPKRGCFVYDKDWKDVEEWEKRVRAENNPDLCIEDVLLKNRGLEIDIKKMVDYIVNKKGRLYEDFKAGPQKMLTDLKNQNPHGIGTVYMITLLYFFSHGECPIYDQFADKALEAICSKSCESLGNMENLIKPGKKIKKKGLPDKNSSKFDNIYENDINDFKKNIKEAFGNYENYKNSRDIDRALWVYGHLFLPMKKIVVKDKFYNDVAKIAE